MINLINGELISDEGLLSCLKELIPPLKSCLSDDWAPDLRFAGCNLLEKVNTILLIIRL